MLPLGISSYLTQISIMVNMTMMNNVLVKYGAVSRYLILSNAAEREFSGRCPSFGCAAHSLTPAV